MLMSYQGVMLDDIWFNDELSVVSIHAWHRCLRTRRKASNVSPGPLASVVQHLYAVLLCHMCPRVKRQLMHPGALKCCVHADETGSSRNPTARRRSWMHP